MGIGASIILIAAGAIIRFAVTLDSKIGSTTSTGTSWVTC